MDCSSFPDGNADLLPCPVMNPWFYRLGFQRAPPFALQVVRKYLREWKCSEFFSGMPSRIECSDFPSINNRFGKPSYLFYSPFLNTFSLWTSQAAGLQDRFPKNCFPSERPFPEIFFFFSASGYFSYSKYFWALPWLKGDRMNRFPESFRFRMLSGLTGDDFFFIHS